MKNRQTEFTKFWHDDTFGHIELLHANYIKHKFAPHIHSGFAIGVCLEGAESFDYRENKYVLSAGNLVVINPNEVHTGEAVTGRGWRYRMIYPEMKVLQHAASELLGKAASVPFFPRPIINDPQLVRAFLAFHDAFEDSFTSNLERQSHLLWVLTRLVSRYADGRYEEPTARIKRKDVRVVRDYLAENYAQNVTLDELAQLVHLSPFHLLRLFKDEVGLAPHAYLMQARITQAKKRLLAGVPIAETAVQTGFADQSHLNKRFKRVVGITPGQYRKNVQDLRPRIF